MPGTLPTAAATAVRLGVATLALLATMFLAGAAWTIGGLLAPGATGSLLMTVGARDADGWRVIRALAPDAPLAQAGAQVGDRMQFDRRSDVARTLRTGEVVPVQWATAEGIRRLPLVAVPDPELRARPLAAAVNHLLSLAIAGLAVLVGVLIGWRTRVPGPLHVLAIVSLAGSMILTHVDWPGTGYRDGLAPAIQPLLYCVVFAGFAGFCLAFPPGMSAWAARRWRVAFAALAAIYVAHSTGLALRVLGVPLPGSGEAWAAPWLPLQGAALLLAAIGIATGWRRSRGTARERVAWIGLSVGTGLVASTLGLVLPLLGVRVAPLDIGLLQASVMLVCIGGLGYAVLRGRVLDSGFAVNRIAVLAVVGLLLFATAWPPAALAQPLLARAGDVGRAAFGVALAALLLALWRPYRAAAERIVLALLYPRWRATEAALATALQQAGTLRGRTALLEHTLAALQRYAGGASIVFYERQGDALVRVAGDWAAAPATLADARELIALQAGRVPPGRVPALGDNALAAPLLHREQLTGLVLLGGRPDFHAYRPDEARRIRHAAALLGEDLRADAQRNQQALLEAKMAAEQEARVTAERLRDAQRELVRRFATPEVAADLEAQGFALGGRRLRATTLFCDIRGFTTLAEGLPPERTIEVLNGYYACMFEAIGRHGGVVNQIVGDGLMAIFGAPVALADAPAAALRAAADMHRLLHEFNAQRAQRGEPPLRIGVGVATGEVIAGYTGTEQRATYTCVGDTVNLAARLEAMTKELQVPILVDGATHDAAGAHAEFAFVPLGAHAVRGRHAPVALHALQVPAAAAPAVAPQGTVPLTAQASAA